MEAVFVSAHLVGAAEPLTSILWRCEACSGTSHISPVPEGTVAGQTVEVECVRTGARFRVPAR